MLFTCCYDLCYLLVKTAIFMQLYKILLIVNSFVKFGIIKIVISSAVMMTYVIS